MHKDEWCRSHWAILGATANQIRLSAASSHDLRHFHAAVPPGHKCLWTFAARQLGGIYEQWQYGDEVVQGFRGNQLEISYVLVTLSHNSHDKTLPRTTFVICFYTLDSLTQFSLSRQRWALKLLPAMLFLSPYNRHHIHITLLEGNCVNFSPTARSAYSLLRKLMKISKCGPKLYAVFLDLIFKFHK